jgi:hypothetical protein
MQRFMNWRYGGALVVLAIIAIACSEAAKNPVAPGEYSAVPLYSATTPFNNSGRCLAADAYLGGKTSGVNDSLDLASGHCTSQDIKIAVAQLDSFSTNGGATFIAYTGQTITCNPGETIPAKMRAVIDETATSARTDIGVWIGLNGGNGRTGSCNHYNLLNGTGSRASQDGGDSCGDLSNAANDTIALGLLQVACQPASATNDSVHVGACLGWTTPGGDQVCPRPGVSGADAFRFATVPGSTSKCNCEGFNIPIIVNKFAKIEVKKVCAPTNDAGTFDLNIDGSPPNAAGQNASCGGATGAVVVSAGTSGTPGASHTVTESDFTQANYVSSYACTKNGSALSSGPGASAGSISVAPLDSVVCTFTNRKKPKIALKKAISPTTDPGKFDLVLAGITDNNGGAGYGNGGITAFAVRDTGSVTVAESGNGTTNLGNYTSTLSCGGKTLSTNTGTGGSLSLAFGDSVTCTFTNTRNGGKLELKKALSPSSDPGKFNLFIKQGATTVASASNVGDGGSTGSGGTSLALGTYDLSETAGTSTALTDYTVTGPTCVNRTGGGSVTVTNGSVDLVSNADVVCTITNTRNTGKLELKKALSPTSDPGKFNLFIKSGATTSASASNVGDGGSTGAGGTTLNTGTYNLSETAGTATSLSSYTVTGPTCVNRTGGGSVTVTNGNVDLAKDADVVCTITNTRNSGKLELKKALSPTSDPGKFNLFIKSGATTVASASNVGDGGSTGAGGTTLDPGTYDLSETAGTSTVLTDYTVTGPSCVNRTGGGSVTVTNGSVELASNADVVCTITNTRNQGSIELKKVWVGTGGQTTLRIGTSANGSDIANQQTGAAGADPRSTGAQPANTGTYYVSETGGLAAYTAQLACTSNGNSITPGTNNSVPVANGAVVVCTFTNTQVPPTISVVKTASPNSIPETGGNVSYSVVVSNNASYPVTIVSLIDSVFGDLSTQPSSTCNSAGNPYGSVAASGTYSCSFSETLAAANAGSTHINKVTASVTSDGGPGSASDTAKVTYTDVLPSISVTKTASQETIFAIGGDSVGTFNQDQRFSRAGGGGGGGPAFNPDVCDDAGPNDEPDQSDLNCFSRADNIAGRLWVRWTWDDINSWTGIGQTGDACSLIDTDNDGNANFAFCVRIENPPNDPTVIRQVAGSPILYSCGDKAADRCSQKTKIEPINATSVCTVSRVDEHFPGVGDDGYDVQAECNLRLLDLGPQATNANTDLLNVCSFPSGSPNSNPFDCVVSPAAGFLVIHKTTTPANSDSYFGFTLRNAANTANDTATNGDDQWEVQGGAVSAALPLLPGTYALNEVMPTNWKLGTISCTRDGSNVGTKDSANAVITSVTIVQGSTTDCTFTNVVSGSASITFTVTVTNNSAEAATLFSLEDTENPDAGTPTYSTLNGVGTCATGGSIITGTPYSCTFSRTVSGVPGTQHEDKVRAVGKDNENNSDTKTSSIVTVTIQ